MIEDAAQAHGAYLEENKVGSMVKLLVLVFILEKTLVHMVMLDALQLMIAKLLKSYLLYEIAVQLVSLIVKRMDTIVD